MKVVFFFVFFCFPKDADGVVKSAAGIIKLDNTRNLIRL